MTPPLRVALAGCGAVGSAFLQLVAERNREGRHRRIEVVRVLVRDPARERGVPLAPDRFTARLDDFLAAPADAVVEAVGGIEPMATLARHALGAGRDWVTANKALVAAHGPELAALARRHGAGFGAEATVAAGVPVVAAVRHGLSDAGIEAVRGVLNGTTNYMISALEEGMGWAAALDRARARGFAEADPGRDLEGLDAADKIRVLAWLAFGIDPARLVVDRLPVPPAPRALLDDARRWGCALRQVAEVRRVETGGLVAVVAPTFVANGSALEGTRFERNLIEIDTAHAGRLRLSGPGAGGRPTASALLTDLLGQPPAPPARTFTAAPPSAAGAWSWAVGFDADAGVLARFRAAAAAAAVAVGGVEVEPVAAGGGRVWAEVGPTPLSVLRAVLDAAGTGAGGWSVARREERCILPPTPLFPQSADSPFTPSEKLP